MTHDAQGERIWPKREIRRFIVTHCITPRKLISLDSFDRAPQLLPRPISAPASPANDYRPLFIFLFCLALALLARGSYPRDV